MVKDNPLTDLEIITALEFLDSPPSISFSDTHVVMPRWFMEKLILETGVLEKDKKC